MVTLVPALFGGIYHGAHGHKSLVSFILTMINTVVEILTRIHTLDVRHFCVVEVIHIRTVIVARPRPEKHIIFHSDSKYSSDSYNNFDTKLIIHMIIILPYLLT